MGPITNPGGGELPYNGIFGWDFFRKLRDITDGTSNTLMMGEFVHLDFDNSEFPGRFEPAPGKVRPWVMGSSRNGPSSYSYKVLQFPPNIVTKVDDTKFNYLPHGSHHVGITVFSLGDGSVRSVSDNVEFSIYQAMGTVNGGEVADL